MNKWPNFFMVGAPRAGTTSLYEFLKKTDDVFMSDSKEPHYFSSIDPKYFVAKPIRDTKKYLSLFEKATKASTIGEASTSYLWDPASHKLIHDTIPSAKIIIMLRDPISRSFSHYLMRLGGGTQLSFLDTVNKALKASIEDYYTHVIVNGSFYSEQVKRYLDTFGSNNVQIIIFEKFINDPVSSVKNVLNFLDVKSEPPDSVDLLHNVFTIPKDRFTANLLQNKLVRKASKNIVPLFWRESIIKKYMSKKSEKPQISKKEREFMKEIFQDDVKQLQKIIGYSLPWGF